jgi:hypothetical protein
LPPRKRRIAGEPAADDQPDPDEERRRQDGVDIGRRRADRNTAQPEHPGDVRCTQLGAKQAERSRGREQRCDHHRDRGDDSLQDRPGLIHDHRDEHAGDQASTQRAPSRDLERRLDRLERAAQRLEIAERRARRGVGIAPLAHGRLAGARDMVGELGQHDPFAFGRDHEGFDEAGQVVMHR